MLGHLRLLWLSFIIAYFPNDYNAYINTISLNDHSQNSFLAFFKKHTFGVSLCMMLQ